jgi:hypothetical protein
MGELKVISYRDPKPEGFMVIETTSRSNTWSKGLSPFLVGPIDLYNGERALNMENAWQYSKVYQQHWDDDNHCPNANWLPWARRGWSSSRADRYPMGKGVTPVCSWWNGRILDYVAARKAIYVPLYAHAVARTEAWAQLKMLYDRGVDLALLDFDAYDHKALGYSYEDVFSDRKRKAGHAFVLAGMLEGFIDYEEAPVSDASLVIFGSRSFTDYDLMKSVILRTQLWKSGNVKSIISGKAPGADRLGERFAREFGLEIIERPAKWEDLDASGAIVKTRQDGTKYNARAGHDRNEVMANEATHAIGFWDGRSPGTKGMLEYCAKIGRPGLVWNTSTSSYSMLSEFSKAPEPAPVPSSVLPDDPPY